jgi:omega-amidase
VRISCIQMNMKLANVDYNFAHAQNLIREAVATEQPDVVVLPETWNIGFFPKDNLTALCDNNGERTKQELGSLAKELNINIVAGSVGNRRENKIYNTAVVFDREGLCIAEYDKIHLFTPLGEHNYFSWGNHISTFKLDGVICGIVICYDIRFPELARTLALQGTDVVFAVAQWPSVRITHINVLAEARAIENQMFFAFTNSCGTAGEIKYGGNSALINPWGKVLVRAGLQEEIITAELDLSIIADIRSSINVFRDRQPTTYKLD